ncbi:DMT family transporter [Leptolyngbya cf. ectocarpi LEGE 11479]|uniref:DMT family transporter n=1 Tax=Leptolyngbya cf. ectocarpi LEGE 11479 TaxID=1828722 RepID=A0A928ZQZ9_LEPEC|nr:DMT family transporter [Leptolyngbya ectocarpi]MBE9066790.1 DMT family transporter [Leptolyngbya cf. ectocarpi LEGE 11479]
MLPPRSTKLLGIGFVLVSALALSLQNVILRLFFTSSLLFGQISFGGFVTPQLGNVVLLLAMRMAVMALLLAGLAPWLYPKTYGVLLALPRKPKLLGTVVASGVCLFLGLTLLYTALSQVAAGVAIATFFIYPAITVLLAWQFFRQAPRAYQLWLMVIIFAGVLLTTLTFGSEVAVNPVLGGLCALGAGLSFGLYGIVAELSLKAQRSHQGLHPIPFSLVTFALVAALAGLTLLVNQSVTITAAAWPPVLVMTLFSAILTLIAYVLNNSGIRLIGASLTALLSASTPALTTLFAWWVLQETLQRQQIIGIGLVSIGVAMLSLKSHRSD